MEEAVSITGEETTIGLETLEEEMLIDLLIWIDETQEMIERDLVEEVETDLILQETIEPHKEWTIIGEVEERDPDLAVEMDLQETGETKIEWTDTLTEEAQWITAEAQKENRVEEDLTTTVEVLFQTLSHTKVDLNMGDLEEEVVEDTMMMTDDR